MPKTLVVFPKCLRYLHWLMGVMILILIGAGLTMATFGYRGVWFPMILYNHKMFGLSILALVVLRLACRMALGVPPPLRLLSRFEVFLGTFVNLCFYPFMFLLPISGYLFVNYGGDPVHALGYTIPSLVNPSPDLSSLWFMVHHYAGYSILVLIVLHLCGVLKHEWIDRVHILYRMLPLKILEDKKAKQTKS